MGYKIYIDHHHKIIRYTHKGTIALTDIGAAWQEFLTIPEFTEKKYNLLSDYRDSNFDFPPNSVAAVIDYLLNLEPILRGKKQSLLVDNPGSTAISMLLENDVNSKVGFLVRVFTDEEAATSWLIF